MAGFHYLAIWVDHKPIVGAIHPQRAWVFDIASVVTPLSIADINKTMERNCVPKLSVCARDRAVERAQLRPVIRDGLIDNADYTVGPADCFNLSKRWCRKKSVSEMR